MSFRSNDKRTLKKASRETKWFHALLDNAYDGVVVYSPEGFITYASPSLKKIGGYQDSNLIGKSGLYFFHPTDRDKALTVFKSVLKKPGKRVVQLARLRHKKGHYLWMEYTLTNMLAVPEVKAIVSNFKDVTSEKEVESKAQESQQLIESISQNISEGIYRSILSKHFVYVNAAFLQLFGYKNLEELNKVGIQQLYANPSERTKIVKQLKQEGQFKNAVVRFKRKDGKLFWGSFSGILVKGKDGKQYVDGAVRDITKERQAREALKEKDILLTTINKNIHEGIFRVSLKKGMVYTNQAFCEIFKYSTSDNLSKLSFADLHYYKKDYQQLVKKLQREKQIRNLELLCKRKSGVPFWGLLSGSLSQNSLGEFFFDGAIRDITEQKISRQQTIESKNFLNNIINTVSAPIFVKDSKLRYVLFNKAFSTFIGLPEREIIGKTNKDFLHPVIYKRIYDQEKMLLKQGKPVFEEQAIRSRDDVKRHLVLRKSVYKNDKGEKFIIGFLLDITDIKNTQLKLIELHANLKAVMESTGDSIYALDRKFRYIAFNENHYRMAKLIYGTKISMGFNKIEMIKKLGDDKWIKPELTRALRGEQFTTVHELSYKSYKNKYVQFSYNPIVLSNNDVSGVAVFAKDITASVLAEKKLQSLNTVLIQQNKSLAKSKEELKQTLNKLSQRNFELDQFVYKTSHDIRAPLSSILGLVNLYKIDNDGTKKEEYINKIQGRVQKLDDFVRSMLDYSKAGRAQLKFEKVNLKELINAAIKDFEFLDNFEKIDVHVQVSGNETPFISDKLKCRIVIGNILSNAYKYYNSSRNKSYIIVNIKHNRRNTTLTFEDNGIGVKPEHLEHVFDMFYRGTEKSEGSGLGMYIVKQAVDALGGKIEVKSEYGQGTCVTVSLPNHH